jgi:hypothetical protein
MNSPDTPTSVVAGTSIGETFGVDIPLRIVETSEAGGRANDATSMWVGVLRAAIRPERPAVPFGILD